MEQKTTEYPAGKTHSLEETRAAFSQKSILQLEESSSVDFKLDKTAAESAKIQIKTGPLNPISHLFLNHLPTLHDSSIDSNLALHFDENSKVETKHKRTKKRLCLDALFQNYHQYAADKPQIIQTLTFIEYLYNRNEIGPFSETKKIDLGLCTIREMVQLCVRAKVLSCELYAQYTFDPLFLDETGFVQKLQRKDYLRMDIEKMYLTPFDHRLLAKLLVSLFPEEYYYPSLIELGDRSLNEFYCFLYSLSDYEYAELQQGLKSRFNRSWIPDFEMQIGLKSDNKQRKKENSHTSNQIFAHPPRKLRKKY